jgi:DNA-binding IclR family transcriptional regulator
LVATGAGEGKEPAYPIGSVDKALRLLLLFREHPTVRLSEAAAAIGVAGSTAHRLLAMLQFHGFVSQDERSRFYVPGPSLLEVGLNVVRSMDIRTVARPHLERLCAELEETIHLAVLEGANVRFLDGLEPDKPLRVASRTGLRLPAHATAVGKVLLAQMDVDRITELLPVPLPRVTQNTTTSLPKLLRQLKEVRERGWAVNKGEAEEDISSIAVAIQGAHGAPHGAISVATPAFRVDADIDRHVKAAQKAADRIAAEVEGLVVPESR